MMISPVIITAAVALVCCRNVRSLLNSASIIRSPFFDSTFFLAKFGDDIEKQSLIDSVVLDFSITSPCRMTVLNVLLIGAKIIELWGFAPNLL